jgi:hypothetical protein
MAVVVFPTPPFWFAMERVSLGGEAFSGRFDLANSQDDPATVGPAYMPLHTHRPRAAGSIDLLLRRSALRKQA